jgi:hypothetical protein
MSNMECASYVGLHAMVGRAKPSCCRVDTSIPAQTALSAKDVYDSHRVILVCLLTRTIIIGYLQFTYLLVIDAPGYMTDQDMRPIARCKR